MPKPVQAHEIIAACPHDCSDNCSMLWTAEGQTLTSVRGHPDHPYTRGGLCVKVNHYEERVMSEDRVLYPLRRSGPKAVSYTHLTLPTIVRECRSRG